MHFRFDEDIHASDAVELDLSFFVLPPVVHPCKIFAVGAVFFIACEEGGPVRTLWWREVKILKASRLPSARIVSLGNRDARRRPRHDCCHEL